MKPEILYNLSETEYHASSGIGDGLWVTRSILGCYDQSPRGCYLRYVAKEPLAQFSGNKGTDFGTIFDMLTTGDEDKLAIGGPINPKTGEPYGKPTKAFDEWKSEQITAGKTVCSQDDYDLAKLMLAECMQSPMLRYILTSDQRKHQVVVRWHDEQTGLPLQVRIDTVLPNGLIDIKTGYKPIKQFTGSAVAFNYDIQAWLYSHAWELATGERLPFIFAYAQTKYPFECAPIQLEQRLIESAQLRCRAAIDGIAAKRWGEPHKVPYVPPVPAYVYMDLESEEGEG